MCEMSPAELVSRAEQAAIPAAWQARRSRVPTELAAVTPELSIEAGPVAEWLVCDGRAFRRPGGGAVMPIVLGGVAGVSLGREAPVAAAPQLARVLRLPGAMPG